MSRYLQCKKPDTSDLLASDLSDDLRRQIRAIALHPPLSPAWIALVEKLQRVSAIALMEQHLPGSEKNANVTIWEVDKLAVRFLIEEARVGVALRCMSEYWQLVLSTRGELAPLDSQATALRLSLPDIRSKMEQFEFSLGLLLECVVQHVEALQTLDMNVLVSHIESVLRLAVSNPDIMARYTTVDKSQPVLVLLYIFDLFEHIEEMRNDREILGMLADHHILHLMGSFLALHHHRLRTPFIQVALQALAMFVDHELFDADQHLRNAEEKRPFIALKDVCERFLSTHGDLRSKLSPILALCSDIKARL